MPISPYSKNIKDAPTIKEWEEGVIKQGFVAHVDYGAIILESNNEPSE